RRAGMTVSATWRQTEQPLVETTETRAVAALSTSLVLPALNAETATQLAEAEGLVTHLTSLVLVDEASPIQEQIPATRKVALPSPRTAQAAMISPHAAMHEPIELRNVPRYVPMDVFPGETILPLPDPFARLIAMIGHSSSELEPNDALRLLRDSGLEKEFLDLYRAADSLGLSVQAIAVLILAGLLGGPLGEHLSP